MAKIHLLRNEAIGETTLQSLSTYWTVNHWNRSRLINVVFLITVENLNWRIWNHCNRSRLDQWLANPIIFTRAHCKFEVRINRNISSIDLPCLKSIELGVWVFCRTISTVFESIVKKGYMSDRSSFARIDWSWDVLSSR